MSASVNTTELQSAIEAMWEERQGISSGTTGVVRDTVDKALDLLDKGIVRVAEKGSDGWTVNQWLKKAVLLSFRLNDMVPISGAPGGATWWDKVPSKFDGMTPDDFRRAGFRAVPGCIVRRSAYIAPTVVLMPSFVNLGAYVDEGTMVDTWATVGSCAQIGKGVHLSGGVGIGGVLEPPSAQPVIIEDGAFIGSRCIVVEGVRVGEEAVLGANVTLTGSTSIIDVTGEKEVVHKGHVPARAVVIPGMRPKTFAAGEYATPCALIIGRRKPSTDQKTSLNDVLREFAVAV